MVAFKALTFNTEVDMEVNAGPVTAQISVPSLQEVVEIVEKQSPKVNN